MCSKEWGRPSREQIWLLFIITATRHGNGGGLISVSMKMRANRLVIWALFPVLSCVIRSPKTSWILIASKSPVATGATLRSWLAVHRQLSGMQKSFPNPGNASKAVVPLCPPTTLPMLIYANIPATGLLQRVFTVLCRRLQNYSECFPKPLFLTHFQLEALLFHPTSQSAIFFFIRFASLLNFSSLLFLCDISLCLH